MANYSTSISYYSDGRTDYEDADESDFFVNISGSLRFSLSADESGNLTGTGSAQLHAFGDAVGETDVGEYDGFDESGSIAISLSGSANGGFSSSFSFGSGGYAYLTGNWSGGALTNVQLVVYAGAGSTTLGLAPQGSPIDDSLEDFFTRLDGIANKYDLLSMSAEAINTAKAFGLARFLKALSSTSLSTLSETFGPAAQLLGAAAATGSVVTALASGNNAKAFGAFMTYFTDLAISKGLEFVTVESATTILISPAPGLNLGGIVLGVAGQAAFGLYQDQINDSVITPFWQNTYLQTGLPALPGVVVDLASLQAGSPVANGIQFTIPAGTAFTFDPGYYLSAHSDALAAVASGQSPSALAYFLTVGAARGDLPSLGGSSVNPATIAQFIARSGDLTAYSPIYNGIFDVALGGLPTDGLSTAESTMGQTVFGSALNSRVDSRLSGLANRFAIDLAHNQQYSGTGKNLYGSSVPTTLSTGALLTQLETAMAPSFTGFSFAVVSAFPGEALGQISNDLYYDISAGASQAYGLAEFGGVWVAVVATPNVGVSLVAPGTESGGEASANFYGTVLNDTIDLGFHHGQINAGTGDDTLVGASGTNTINGGGGLDTLFYSVASSQAAVAHNANGSWTITVGSTGETDTITNVERVRFADKTIALRELDRTDVTGSGTSGMILQSGGIVVDWALANGAYATGNVLTTAATGYTVGGAGDFNGDGTADVVLQSGGIVVDWILSNGAYQSGNVITTAATGYAVKGTGDFNGDGTSDIVLQSGGIVVDWIMKNGTYQSGNVLTTAATGYTVVGTGDFNGDGTTDILLQSGGTVVDWIMKNGAYQTGNVITNGATGFTVVGAGDFNGDGTTDVLLQNASGTVIDWIMKNGVYQSGNTITTGAAGYTVVGTGDYNGDGTADIALQSGGTIADWLMHNGTYQSGSVITSGATGYSVKA